MRDKLIVAAASDMEECWDKWHVSDDQGGHPGVRVFELRFQQSYWFEGNLRKWTMAQQRKCRVCYDKHPQVFTRPPPAVISSTRPYERIIMDHTSMGVTDIENGATYAIFVDFSKKFLLL